jgi:hypothetical protein
MTNQDRNVEHHCPCCAAPAVNPEEIDLADDDDEAAASAANPEEIDIDDVVSDGDEAAAAAAAADEVPEGDPGPGVLPAAAAAAEHEAGAAAVPADASTARGQLPGGVSFNRNQPLQGGQTQQRRNLTATLPPPRAEATAAPLLRDVDMSES